MEKVGITGTNGRPCAGFISLRDLDESALRLTNPFYYGAAIKLLTRVRPPLEIRKNDLFDVMKAYIRLEMSREYRKRVKKEGVKVVKMRFGHPLEEVCGYGDIFLNFSPITDRMADCE